MRGTVTASVDGMLQTINDWLPETKSLIEALEAAGITIVHGGNGEDTFKYPAPGCYPSAFALFIEELTACDEGWLYVRPPDEKETDSLYSIYLVYGNSPGELVSDYTTHPLIDAVAEQHYDKWDGKPQPKRQIDYAAIREAAVAAKNKAA